MSMAFAKYTYYHLFSLTKNLIFVKVKKTEIHNLRIIIIHSHNFNNNFFHSGEEESP
jgi:hypothetical protein